MLIRLTMNELQHLALKQLNLETELSYHSSGMSNHKSPHTIEIVTPIQGDEDPLLGSVFKDCFLQTSTQRVPV